MGGYFLQLVLVRAKLAVDGQQSLNIHIKVLIRSTFDKPLGLLANQLYINHCRMAGRWPALNSLTSKFAIPCQISDILMLLSVIHSLNLLIISTLFWPPNPNDSLIATSIFAFRGLFGT